MTASMLNAIQHKLGWIFLLCLVGMIAACGDSSNDGSSADESDSAGAKTVHPTSQNIPADEAVADVIKMDTSPEGTGPLARRARRMRAAKEVLSIGAMEGKRREVIGKVQDVATDEGENIYLLDSRYNEVRIFDRKGTFVQKIGGPEMLKYPDMLEFSRDGKLLVTDRAGNIEVFVREDTSLVHNSTLALDTSPIGFCTMADTLYVRSLIKVTGSSNPAQPQKSIHVYSKAGTPVRSFGQPYKSDNALVQLQLSMGPLACSAEAQMLTSAFSALPVLSGYSRGGKLKWQSKLAGFRPPEITEITTDDGRSGVRNDATPASSGEESDYIKSLVTAPGGLVIVQTGRHTIQSVQAGKDYAELHTYLIDTNTGKGVYVSGNLPPIYDATANRIYAGVNAPFPQVKVYRLPSRGE